MGGGGGGGGESDMIYCLGKDLTRFKGKSPEYVLSPQFRHNIKVS